VTPSAPKPAVPSAPRPVPLAPSPAPGLGKAPVVNRAPADSWPEEAPPARPPVAPSASRPVAATSYASTPRYVPSAPAAAPAAPSKPDEDDKIGPVGTAYTPIKLQPKKLVNPFAARQAQAQEESSQIKSQPTGMYLSVVLAVQSNWHVLRSWQEVDMERAPGSSEEANRRRGSEEPRSILHTASSPSSVPQSRCSTPAACSSRAARRGRGSVCSKSHPPLVVPMYGMLNADVIACTSSSTSCGDQATGRIHCFFRTDAPSTSPSTPSTSTCCRAGV